MTALPVSAPRLIPDKTMSGDRPKTPRVAINAMRVGDPLIEYHGYPSSSAAAGLRSIAMRPPLAIAVMAALLPLDSRGVPDRRAVQVVLLVAAECLPRYVDKFAAASAAPVVHVRAVMRGDRHGRRGAPRRFGAGQVQSQAHQGRPLRRQTRTGR